MLQEIENAAREAVMQLLSLAAMEKGDLFVVGCSTSEIAGQRIGSASAPELAQTVLAGILPLLQERGIFLAAQCCEHLNRALILEKEAACLWRLPQVCVVPKPKAGGSFATAAWNAFVSPVAVEEIHCAKAGMDIGDTLIGMHFAPVAVPVRLSVRRIGEANLVCARSRPKLIGGERACYQ